MTGVDGGTWRREATFTKRTIRCVPDAKLGARGRHEAREGRCCSGSSARDARGRSSTRGARMRVAPLEHEDSS